MSPYDWRGTLKMRVRLRALWRPAAAVATMAMLVAACGGSSGKHPAAGTATSEATTATSVQPDATESTPTTVNSVGATNASPTTVHATTPTTARKRTSIATAPSSKAVTAAPTGGITSVTSPPSTAPAANIQPGGSVTWLRGGDMSSFDPAVMSNAGTVEGLQGAMVYDLLLYSDGGTITPQTAEALTSPDGLVWTLKLHPNIKFTDGTPYDAAAVKFNIERMQGPTGRYQKESSTIATMEVVDPATLRLTLKAKNALFPGLVAFFPYVGSPTAIQQSSDKMASNPVGAGPFMLKSWVRDSTMVLVRNPNYWRSPMPYIDQFTIKSIIDETQRINSMCAGEAEITYVGGAASADQLQKQNCGVNHPIALNGGFMMAFNTTKAPMNDPRLRQAIAMAIDQNDYSKIVTNGIVPPMLSMFRPDSPFYDAKALLPAYDPVKAQQLFDQVAADNGGTVKISFSTYNVTPIVNSATYIQAKLNGYKNVKVDFTPEATSGHTTACV